jgi:hypothetical protein
MTLIEDYNNWDIGAEGFSVIDTAYIQARDRLF